MPTTISPASITKTGDFDLALEHYQDALRLSPDSVQAHVNYGLWLVSRGRFDEGMAQYRIALDIYPQHSRWRKSHLGLALVSSRQDR